jgi:hypothetical protein
MKGESTPDGDLEDLGSEYELAARNHEVRIDLLQEAADPIRIRARCNKLWNLIQINWILRAESAYLLGNPSGIRAGEPKTVVCLKCKHVQKPEHTTAADFVSHPPDLSPRALLQHNDADKLHRSSEP